MATIFRHYVDGTDFDDMFDPYVQGTKPANTGFRTTDGVDLADRYAPIEFGTKRADVGYRTAAGVDVSNLWAAKGTASYFPTIIQATSYSFTGLPRAAAVKIAIRTNGTIPVTTNGTTSTSGAGTHNYAPTAAGASSAFDFRIFGTVYGVRNIGSTANITGKGGININAAVAPGGNLSFDTGWIATADDAGDFLVIDTASPTGAGESTIQTMNPNTVTIQVRRKSDGQIVRTYAFGLLVSSDSQQ
jgi:hypothetical protein